MKQCKNYSLFIKSCVNSIIDHIQNIFKKCTPNLTNKYVLHNMNPEKIKIFFIQNIHIFMSQNIFNKKKHLQIVE